MPGGFNFGGMPGGRGGGAQTFHFSSGGPGGGSFNFSNPEDIFADFFRQSSGGMDDDMGGIPGMGGGFRGFGGMPQAARGGGGRRSSRFNDVNGGPRQPTPEVTVLERPLMVSLEDLYKGTTKKMKIQRKKFNDGTGKLEKEERLLTMPIKPGFKAGGKFKFTDVGDQVEGGTQDMHFVVKEVSSLQPPLLNVQLANLMTTETPPPLHPRRRRPKTRRRNRSQGSPNRLVQDRPNHRRQIVTGRSQRSHTTYLDREVPEFRYAEE